MPRLFYTLLLYLLLLFVPFKLLWRGIRQPAYLRHWNERFGFYNHPLTKPLIWLHCVSVGETRAAAPLVAELRKRYPQHQLLLTHATPTGRTAGEQLFDDSVLRAYLPYDLPGAVRRFLSHFKPETGLLMETELWFNLIAACKTRHIPLLLVNARLSQKSADSYARFPNLVSQGLHNLSAIAAQTEPDAERLRNLGATNVSVLGNLKFDVVPPPEAHAQGVQLRTAFAGRPVLLAASTRAGEEPFILEALAIANIPNLLTIIVPRHPQRFDEVADLLEKSAFDFARRSKPIPVQPATQVFLGDSMGELFTYYAACDVAFIGGSLLPFGGQNLIEACAMGKPVLLGPYTYNFAAAAEQALAMNAAWQVQNASELAIALQRLFLNPQTITEMGQAALRFSSSATGATQRIADLIENTLAQPSVSIG